MGGREMNFSRDRMIVWSHGDMWNLTGGWGENTLGDNLSPDSFLGLEEVVEEVSVELTGCSGRAAAAAHEITQGEIVTRTMAFTQGAVRQKLNIILSLSNNELMMLIETQGLPLCTVHKCEHYSLLVRVATPTRVHWPHGITHGTHNKMSTLHVYLPLCDGTVR